MKTSAVFDVLAAAIDGTGWIRTRSREGNEEPLSGRNRPARIEHRALRRCQLEWPL